MNTRTRTYLVHARQLPATAALLALFGFAAVAAAGPGWRVTLTDDSRILVTPESSNLLLESSSLDTVISVPVSTIRSIVPAGGEKVTIQLSGGDRLTGQLGGEALEVRSILGDLEIPPETIRRIERLPVPKTSAAKNDSDVPVLKYEGLLWQAMRTGWEVRDGKLASKRCVRKGFDYGHGGRGRGGLILTGNGDETWTDYEVAFDYKMLPANREFFHAHIPGDSRGMSVKLRAKSVTESWNQPSTCYGFSIRPDGNWQLGAAEDSYWAGRGWSADGRRGKRETLAKGKLQSTQDASHGRLRLRVEGSTITVWLNDEKLVQHTHEGKVVKRIAYGGFGVQWRWEAMGWISDLEVEKFGRSRKAKK